MTVHINESVEVNAPISVAWAYVDDYRNVPDWLYGVNKFVPTGEIENGLGAVYDAEMMVGVPIKTRVEITAWEFEKSLALDSISGFQSSSEWMIEALDDNRTRLKGHVAYDLPFGIAGRAMGKLMEPAVKIAVRKSSDAIVRNIEALLDGA